MKIFFSHSKKPDLFSSLIKLATKSQWTHCGFILDPKLGMENLVAECAWNKGGFNLGFWFMHEALAFEIYEFECSLEAQLGFVRDSPNIQYAYAKIVLFGISLVFGLHAMEVCSRLLQKLGLWQDPFKDGMWCSEYCYSFFQRQSESLGIEKESDVITPEDLYQAIRLNPRFRKVV